MMSAMPARSFHKNNAGGGGRFPRKNSFIIIILLAHIFVGSPKIFLKNLTKR